MDNAWLEIPDAAEYLRVSPRTLQQWLQQGRMRYSWIGRRRVVHARDIDAYIESLAVPAQPERVTVDPEFLKREAETQRVVESILCSMPGYQRTNGAGEGTERPDGSSPRQGVQL